MRTIQTENATYKIADSRNLQTDDFVKQLKKPKSAAKRYKAEKRVFPVFFAGKTSTREYVRVLPLEPSGQALSTLKVFLGFYLVNPSPDFAIEDDVIEVKLLEEGMQ
jgi:hypothetical protein